MGRARWVVLALATLAIAAPASGDVADTWAPYTPVVEQVQSIAATPGGSPQQALLAVIARPLAGLSRLDVIRPIDDPLNPRSRQLTTIPTDPLHIGTGVEVDPFANQYVGVASMRGDGRSLSAGVLRRRPTATPGESGEWRHLAGRFDFAWQMELPWGLAFHPNGSLYVTDAARGEIVRIKNAATIGNPPSGTWFVTADPNYAPLDDPLPGSGILGTRSLGVTGIAVCRQADDFYCLTAGNLLVINTATGRLWEVPVLADTTLGEPEFRGTPSGQDNVMGLRIDASGRYYLAESRLHRVLRIESGGAGARPLVWSCPGSDPSDVAVIGETAFVANRNRPTSPNPMCPMPSVTRVIMSP